MWRYFPEHYMFSYTINRVLTQSLYGGGETFEVLEAASRIKEGDRHSFYEAFAWQGERVKKEGLIAEEKGYFETARASFLKASNYYRTAEFFLQLGDDKKEATYLEALHLFQRSIPYWKIKPDIVQIPYEGSSLPGYLFKTQDTLPENSPLVIMFGGLDSCAEEMWYGPGQILVDRGVSLLVIDGPGQGGALRLNGIHTRYDYDVVGTIAFDWAVANLPVDPNRIGILAVSMGGYMAARIAAFEPRFKACAIWGAVWSYYDIWKNRPDNHPLAPIVMHILDASTIDEARKKLKKFTLDGVADKIPIPTFICHGEDDQQNFVDNAYKTYDALTCEKQLLIVPMDGTGSSHCQIDNFSKAFPLIDWFVNELTT